MPEISQTIEHASAQVFPAKFGMKIAVFRQQETCEYVVIANMAALGDHHHFDY